MFNFKLNHFMSFLVGGVLTMAVISASSKPQPVEHPVSSEAYIGEVFAFAGSFCPRNFVSCDGKLLDIANNQALFAIIGNSYGGDGKTNFAVPNLKGRTPVGMTSRLGERLGDEFHAADDAKGAGVGMNYCICTAGIFPQQ